MATTNALPDATILDIEDYWANDAGWPQPPSRDPYLRWAALTNFRSLQRGDNEFPAKLSFIAERTGASQGWGALGGLEGVTVEAVFSDPLADGRVARFATLRVGTEDLSTPEVARRVLALLRHADLERLQLGYPRGRNRDFAFQSPCPPGKGACPKPMPEVAEVVLGIIDDGCPFAHADLCDASGQTRVAALWQQSTFDRPDLPWVTPTGLGYGRMLDRSAMNGFIERAQIAGSLDETLCYQAAFAQDEEGFGRKWHKPNRTLLTRASHGGSVMAVAGGKLPGLHGERPAYETGDCLHGERNDAASRCPLIFVDMPREQVEISSGRWLPVSGLDGLRFILQEARARHVRANGSAVPVVINVSSGSTAGAHSGGAMFERAMHELLSADRRLAIMLAAGNSRDAESHACLDVPRRGSTTVGVFVPAAQPFDTFVEFWLPAGADLSTVSFTVTSPEGLVLSVNQGRREAVFVDGEVKAETAEERATRVGAALLFYPRVVQATDRTMVLLAVCGTVYSARRLTVASSGPWRVTVSQSGASDLRVQAWIERDEIVFGNRRDQAARFFEFDVDPAGTATQVRKTNTLSNIASGELTFAVAAYRGNKGDGPMADYSGAPPDEWQAQHRYLPFAAKADAGRSHPGVRVAGNRGNVVRRMNGTSVAAPQAARFVVNEMAKNLTRAQVERKLPREPNKLPGLGDPTQLRIDPSDGRLRV